MSKARFLSTILFSLVLLSCNSLQSKKSVSSRIAAYVGKSLPLSPDSVTTVTPGTRVFVKLRKNAGTGFSWSFTSSDPVKLKAAGSESFRSHFDEPRTGAPIEEVWLFDAREDGVATLTFIYKRPWENTPSSARTNKYVVRIKH